VLARAAVWPADCFEICASVVIFTLRKGRIMTRRRSLTLLLLGSMLLPAGSALAGTKVHAANVPAAYQYQANSCRTRQQVRRSNYRNSRPAYYRRRDSTLRTALTIAAPAAVGAGVGALAGGGKGAAVGALLGGGGGAIYHLIKRR